MVKLSARDIAEQITKGKRKPQFIGPKSRQVIIQEIWSLKNTKDAFRKSDWKTRLLNLKAQLRSLHGTDYSEKIWRDIFKDKEDLK